MLTLTREHSAISKAEIGKPRSLRPRENLHSSYIHLPLSYLPVNRSRELPCITLFKSNSNRYVYILINLPFHKFNLLQSLDFSHVICFLIYVYTIYLLSFYFLRRIECFPRKTRVVRLEKSLIVLFNRFL